MPTTGTSNNPHVRITPDVHYDLRRYSVLIGKSQGDIVADLLREKLEEEGNPHLVLNLPPRQTSKPKETVIAVAPQAPRRPPGRPRTRPLEQPAPEPRRRGRPPGSKNRQPEPAPAPAVRQSRRKVEAAQPPPQRSSKRSPAGAAR